MSESTARQVWDEIKEIAPWIMADSLWDAATWERALYLARKADVQEGRVFSSPFSPVIMGIRYCLVGSSETTDPPQNILIPEKGRDEDEEGFLKPIPPLSLVRRKQGRGGVRPLLPRRNHPPRKIQSAGDLDPHLLKVGGCTIASPPPKKRKAALPLVSTRTRASKRSLEVLRDFRP